MARRTHYDVLGIARNASSVDIAAAYRDKLADLKSKPDSEEEASTLREAYQTLASPDRRAEYDQELEARMPVRRRAAQAASASVDEDGGSKRYLKYAIAAALVVLVVVGWKMRKPNKPPQAQIVSTVRVEEPEPESPPARRAESSAQPAAASSFTPTGSMSPEQLFATVSPSVVRVLAGDSRQGSGVVVESGSVITNCHVTKDSSSIKVKAGSELLPATLAVADEALDLCSLKVPRLDAPAASLGTIAGLKTGQRVYAIGAPMGLELTISEGIVSALREVDVGKVIQTTAPVSPGSSGGGLFTADGQLVGIVTFQHKFGQNLNFALPADWIAEMRNRKGGPAYASSTPAAVSSPPTDDASPAELIVGTWHCLSPLSGRNGMYTYGADGMMRITSPDGRNVSAAYRVVGRTVRYTLYGDAFVFEIESISGSRMVQFVEAGQRLACERS